MTSGVNNKKKYKKCYRCVLRSCCNHFYDTSSELFSLGTSKI